MPPVFSIVMATYNRGLHIVPTVKSVLEQSFKDYELLIVGDGCTDNTAAILRPYLSDRVTWTNLPKRWGSQFAPNNAAIERARGRYIAYLGHDDLWAPGHLAALHRTFLANPGASIAASGCICYGPPGSGVHLVTGLFDDDDAKFKYFFPPSSFAHRSDLTQRIGPWRAPETIKSAIDADLLLRAAHAGQRFVSTGEITVHKFASGGRYLAYARLNSQEQMVLARMMSQPGFESFVAEVVAHARETGTVGLPYPDLENVAEGHYHEQIGFVRGIRRPPLVTLDGHATMLQSDESRALDWKPPVIRDLRLVRWSGPNPRPRMLIPFTAPGGTRLRFGIYGASDDHVIDGIRLTINGEPVSSQVRRRASHGRRAVLQCEVDLPADDHTVVEFDLTVGLRLEDLVRCVAGRPERIALGGVSLRPGRVAPGIMADVKARAARMLDRLTKH